MKHFGVALYLAGTLLLLTTVLGHWTNLGRYESTKPRNWEQFEPRLEGKTTSLRKLVKITSAKFPDKAMDRDKMDILYGAVANRFTHGEAAHAFFSNWILYSAGKLTPAFSHIWDPDLLLSKGHSAICDQASYVLLTLARANGIKARHVGLNGHVVMEAWYGSDWHLYDPDLEVVPLDGAGDVLSVEELAMNQELLDKYYGPHRMTEIVRSREDNTYATLPEGARFEWKSNVLAYSEGLMEALKFLIPCVLIVAGLLLEYRRRTRT